MLFHQLGAPLLEESTLNGTKRILERVHNSIHTFKNNKMRNQLGAKPLLCRCFQPEPIEILAKPKIEGKEYRGRLCHALIHEALALNVQRQNSVGHMGLEEHGI